MAIEALKARADDYMEKPVGIARLKETVEGLLEARRGEGGVNEQGLKGKIEKVKRFMERNWYKKITLNEAAGAVCLSPKYLSRIFKENIKKGFSDYKLELKIGKAKELLKKGDYNVNQISERMGYENTESFIRQFKKLAGYTPTEYRKKVRPGKSPGKRAKTAKRKR
ncbi:MAG: DNA-binding response regulator [Candidatus Omnitrophota bacterium]|jgi:YesN/AraC family two-component response regulator